MKKFLINTAIWFLSRALPLETIIGKFVANEAVAVAQQEARALAYLQAKRVAAVAAAPHVLTPASVDSLVAAHVASAVVTGQFAPEPLPSARTPSPTA